VDLYVTTDIRTMIDIWLGKRAWDAAVGSGRVEVVGPRELRDRIKSWLLLSPIRVKSAVAPDQDRIGSASAQLVVGTESIPVRA
jgi:hypothetical protein